MARDDFDDAYTDWDDDVKVTLNPRPYHVDLHPVAKVQRQATPYAARLGKVWWELNGPITVGFGVGLVGAVSTGLLAGLAALSLTGPAGVLAAIGITIVGGTTSLFVGATVREAMDVLRGRE